jgi:Spy/CpxP family protein refolding chaperone
MKIKFIPVLVSAIALGLGTVPVLTAPAQAQDAGTPTQARPMKGRMMQDLNLTADQRARIQQIREETRAAMEQILTPTQRQQLQDAKAQAQANPGQWKQRRGMKQALNLTEEQKTRMRELKQSAQEQISAVLTAEQRQQLQEKKQMRQQRRQQQQNNQPAQ